MKILTDKLTERDLRDNLPDGVILDRIEAKGSRKRDHGFLVKLAAIPGKDAHGITRKFAYNRGSMVDAGDTDGTYRALTWVEYGDWMFALFTIDPDAIIGSYEGLDDFLDQTYEAAYNRNPRENAVFHAERWSREAFYGVSAVTA